MRISELPDVLTAAAISDDGEIRFGVDNTGTSKTNQLSLTELKKSLPIRQVGTDCFAINPNDNSIDVGVSVSVITASGSASYPNRIGSTGKPVGTDFTPTGWADDAGYVSGAADVATISGGYDNIVNAIAGAICGGGHNFIKYNVGGHGFIGGGSYNVLDAARSVIVGGRRNTITGGATTEYCAIVGGDNNNIVNADYGIIVGGSSNAIPDTGGSVHCFIGSGSGNSVDATASVIVGGQNNVVTGNWAGIVGGYNNEVSANYGGVLNGRDHVVSAEGASAIGYGHTAKNIYATVMGSFGVSISPNSLTIARDGLVEDGDAQIVTAVMAARTSDATLTNLNTLGTNQFIELDDTKVTVGTAKILLTAIKDGSADGNNDSNYEQVSYSAEVGFYWDGTNGFFFDAAGQTAVAASPTRDLTLLAGNTNNDFTAGAAPHLAINTGALRLKVTGLAATKINWVARIDLVMATIS